MSFTKRIINKVLCFIVLANICCCHVNAAGDIVFCDYRFVRNVSIIDRIKSSVNFKGLPFISLWSIDREKESTEHLTMDTEHIVYTVQMSPALKVDEIFISAPIIDTAYDKKMVGTVFLSAKYGNGVEAHLSDVIKDFCLIETMPRNLNLAETEDIQYFLNAPDAPIELPVEYEKIENLPAFAMKKDNLEVATLIINDREKTILDVGLSNVCKFSLINLIKTDE